MWLSHMLYTDVIRCTYFGCKRVKSSEDNMTGTNATVWEVFVLMRLIYLEKMLWKVVIQMKLKMDWENGHSDWRQDIQGFIQTQERTCKLLRVLNTNDYNDCLFFSFSLLVHGNYLHVCYILN